MVINKIPTPFSVVILPSFLVAGAFTLAVSLSYLGLLFVILGSSRLVNFQVMMLGPWLLALLAGFFLQLFLYFYHRRYAKFAHALNESQKMPVAAASSLTGVGMLACCVHRIFEILPFLGLGAIGMFFGRLQIQFLELGIAANIVGILFMMSVIQRHRLYANSQNVLFSIINYRIAMQITIVMAILYLSFSVVKGLI